MFKLENCFKSYIFSLSFAQPKVFVKLETIALLCFRPSFPPAKSTSLSGRSDTEKGGLYIPVFLSHYIAVFLQYVLLSSNVADAIFFARTEKLGIFFVII